MFYFREKTKVHTYGNLERSGQFPKDGYGIAGERRNVFDQREVYRHANTIASEESDNGA